MKSPSRDDAYTLLSDMEELEYLLSRPNRLEILEKTIGRLWNIIGTEHAIDIEESLYNRIKSPLLETLVRNVPYYLEGERRIIHQTIQALLLMTEDERGRTQDCLHYECPLDAHEALEFREELKALSDYLNEEHALLSEVYEVLTMEDLDLSILRLLHTAIQGHHVRHDPRTTAFQRIMETRSKVFSQVGIKMSLDEDWIFDTPYELQCAHIYSKNSISSYPELDCRHITAWNTIQSLRLERLRVKNICALRSLTSLKRLELRMLQMPEDESPFIISNTSLPYLQVLEFSGIPNIVISKTDPPRSLTDIRLCSFDALTVLDSQKKAIKHQIQALDMYIEDIPSWLEEFSSLRRLKIGIRGSHLQFPSLSRCEDLELLHLSGHEKSTKIGFSVDLTDFIDAHPMTQIWLSNANPVVQDPRELEQCFFEDEKAMFLPPWLSDRKAGVS